MDDPTKFIICIGLDCIPSECVSGTTFDEAVQTCKASSVTTTTAMQTTTAPPATYDCAAKNPCSPLAIAGQAFYPMDDPTKFIICIGSDCIPSDCVTGTTFDETAQTCKASSVTTTTAVQTTTVPRVTYDCGAKNPCSPLAIAGQAFYPMDDPTKFIICIGLDCIPSDCVPNTTFDEAVQSCITKG